jgi:serine/threonine protein kinase
MEEVRRATTVIGGTPYYMAPEQTRGAAAGPSADLYSLGVTFFELATGRLPFTGGDIAGDHRNTAPPDPRDLAADLPDPLAELIVELLAKKPADRPASAADAGARLAAIEAEADAASVALRIAGSPAD